MGLRSEKEDMRFVDLLATLTKQDLRRRQVIEASGLEKSNDLNDFLDNWRQLRLGFGDETEIVGGVKRLPSITEEKYVCKLAMEVDGKLGLGLSFAAKDAPVYGNHRSPVALYNTKVKLNRIEGFEPFSYYDAIMYLIRAMVPENTKLTLYVRQRDSRHMLDRGEDPRVIPLTRVFVRAGWEYGGYTLMTEQADKLRRHRLVLYSGE